MKAILKLEIECGKDTCLSESGKRCRYLTAQRLGLRHYCQLFSIPTRTGVTTITLELKDGKILRHADCLATQEKISSKT